MRDERARLDRLDQPPSGGLPCAAGLHLGVPEAALLDAVAVGQDRSEIAGEQERSGLDLQLRGPLLGDRVDPPGVRLVVVSLPAVSAFRACLAAGSSAAGYAAAVPEPRCSLLALP